MLGVKIGTVRYWLERGLPRAIKGRYDVIAAAKWIIGRHLEQRKSKRRRALPAGDGSTLDRKRILESKKLELQLLEMEKQVAPVAMVDEFLGLVKAKPGFGASLLRSIAERMQSLAAKVATLPA